LFCIFPGITIPLHTIVSPSASPAAIELHEKIYISLSLSLYLYFPWLREHTTINLWWGEIMVKTLFQLFPGKHNWWGDGGERAFSLLVFSIGLPPYPHLPKFSLIYYA
jgi:hypothetical protein